MMIRFPMIFRGKFFLSGSARKTAGQKHRRQYRSRPEFHIHFGVAPGIQEQHSEKDTIGQDHPPVQIFPEDFCIPYWHSASEVPGKLPKKVPASMISINVLFISLHHPDSDQNDQDADDVLKRKIS